MIDRPLGSCPRCGAEVFRTGGHTEEFEEEEHWFQTGQCPSCGAHLERDQGVIEWSLADSPDEEGEEGVA